MKHTNEQKIKIEVLSTETKVLNGEKNGRQWSMRLQGGYLHFPDRPYPVNVDFNIDAGETPLSKGYYFIDYLNSIYVDRRGRIQIKPVFVPLSS